MPSPIVNFLAKTYKIWIVVVAATLFFLGYNTYLVDHSLVNLKIVLTRADDIKTIDDAKKLAAVLDYSVLTEVASAELQSANISKLELAKDILSNMKDKGQLKDVKMLLRQVIEKKEKQRPALLVALDNLGRVFAPAGAKFSKAKLEAQARYLADYVKTVKDKAKLQEAYYELGNVYTKLSEFDQAREAYKKVVELDSGTPLARKSEFNLAWNEKYRGNLDEAVKEFESLSLVSGDEGIKSFSEYQLADSLKKKGEYEKSSEIFRRVGKKYPREEFAQLATFQAGYINLYDLADYDKAMEIFQEAKALFKGSRIVSHIEKVTMDNIVREFRKKGFRLIQEGRLLLSSSLYERANGYFDKGLEIVPQDGISYIGKALAYLFLKDKEKALSFGERALELAPNTGIVVNNLGYIYTDLGMPYKSIKLYRKYLAFDRKNQLIHYNLGYDYAISGQFTAAVKELNMAIKLNPEYAHAYNNLGWCFWQLRKFSKSVEAFKKAVKLQPKFERAQFNLGQAYMILGAYGEAKKAFESISEASAEYGQARRYLQDLSQRTRGTPGK